MSKILTKKIQTQLSDYFLSEQSYLTKPETRCMREMVVGILKSKTVFVNQIAASLRENLKLKDVTKRLSAQYLKDGYAEKVRSKHLSTVAQSISKNDFIVMDGTDISKKYAKYMEGLEFVKNGDTAEIGLGYNVLNINAINTHKEMIPLYSKAYSFQMGALSINNEIKKGVREAQLHIGDNGCWVFDRGADNEILKNFFISECSQTIIRLKRSTKLCYKGKQHKVSELVKKIDFCVSRQVTKTKKVKQVVERYELGAVKIDYKVRGRTYGLWLVVSRNLKTGGLCFLLVKSNLNTSIQVADWAFKGYGLRWKIEEYHRHVKQEYGLEDIQIKTFTGLQSILAILTTAMYILYKKINSIHMNLLLESGYNFLNKHKISELTNFIYYKISKVVAILLMPTRIRWKINTTPNQIDDNQILLAL